MSDLTKSYGCGVFSAVFGLRSRRSASTSSLPNDILPSFLTTPSNPKSQSTRVQGSNYSSSPNKPQIKADRIISGPSPNQKRKASPPLNAQTRQQVKKSEPNGQRQNQITGKNKKLSEGASGIAEDLEAMIDENQRSIDSGNMKVYGNLGNLGNLKQAIPNNVDFQPKTKTVRKELPSVPDGTGNIIPRKESRKPAKPTSYSRALSTRMDPEQLNIMGNEDYKNGRFAEALSLYDAAISIDPEKASYRSNKSAALTALGMLLEAVFEAKEAIRIEPFYQRAHNRLATLYLRLGDPEKTIRHYKQAGSEVEPDLLTKARNLLVQLKRCNEAKKQKDWNKMLTETDLAISAGADSALQIYALKAEALLKLLRHHEADEVLSNAPKFDVDDCIKFYGPISHAYFLVVKAHVDLTAGRIDDAMEASQLAANMDSNNKDVNIMVRKIRAVTGARSKGNDLYKAANYTDACIAYGEGLDHDPFNSVLLCNRAACRTKLGQFEKAVEDCTMALNIRPSYSKARLRRADCNAKLGKWQASIEDYEVLTREAPEDEEVSIALRQAKEQLKRH